MKLEQAEGRSGYKAFQKVNRDIYAGNRCYRGTEGNIERLLIKGPTEFHRHASVKPFLIRDGNDIVGRFALIHDDYLPGNMQVSFFEALPGLKDVFLLIRKAITINYPGCSKVVIGLNGHLNYGAGFLLNRFDVPPLFGLPYTPPYYPDYFSELTEKRMFSFRFPIEGYAAWAKSYPAKRSLSGLNVRFMNKADIKSESAIYTLLNNKAFIHHPYWAKREEAEDLELFSSFRYFLKNENLVIAEYQGQPVGFYLWYPDFNQLLKTQRELNVFDVLHYKIKNPIDTIRFTEIGIIPEFQNSPVAFSLVDKALSSILDGGYKYCEGGFIFEENKSSIAFVSRLLTRSFGQKPEPYRVYAVYETRL